MKRNLTWAAVALVSLFAGAATGALPQRTFVASTGADTNPCSRSAPCRGFQAAVAAVNDGGEVIVLDSSGYGPVTVSKSVTIVAPKGIYAGISTPATGNATGVLIDTAGVGVVLRGLTINGIGGAYGIRMTNGAKLAVENCVISNFATGDGVSIEAAAFVSIVGSTIRDNYDGVIAGYGAVVNIAKSKVLVNIFDGILLAGGAAGSSTGIFISDTVLTGTGQSGTSYCIDEVEAPGASGVIEATGVTISSCYFGVINEGFGVGTITVGRSTVTNSHVAFENLAGTFHSLGDNHVTENSIATVGPITVVTPQ